MLGAAYWLGNDFQKVLKPQEVRAGIVKFIDGNIDRISEELGKHYGVKFPDPPLVNAYQNFDDLEDILKDALMIYRGTHITVNMEKSQYSSFTEKDKPKFWKRGYLSVEEGLKHEIGHSYARRIRGELRLTGQLHDHDKRQHQNLVNRIVEEGIAEYIGREYPERRPRESIGWLEEQLFDHLKLLPTSYPSVSFDIAHQFVKPILDELGLEKGLKAIYRNPIVQESELKKPELYHQRIIVFGKSAQKQ